MPNEITETPPTPLAPTAGAQYDGLHSAELESLRARYGYNELPEFKENPLLLYLKNFWGPLPWLMELMVVITFFSGNQVEAAIIVALLLMNSGINLLQRRSANRALATLRKAIQVTARAERDGAWDTIPSRELLPGDIVRVRAGDVVPADMTFLEGTASIDFSTLTGESLPKDIGAGGSAYSGSIVRRGEAIARVTAIGKQTRYGKTTELLETSHPPTHMEKIIFSIIRYFFFLNIGVAIGITVFGVFVHAPGIQIVNYVIVLLLMSVPVAFPTMFIVAQTYGALQLSTDSEGSEDTGKRVLTRRLGAVQEAAVMDVLCSDKTGTLTFNMLAVTACTTYGTYDERQLLGFASAASDTADRDSIDQAILANAATIGAVIPQRASFTPFDSSTKRTRAEIVESAGRLEVEKGLADLLLTPDVRFSEEALRDVAALGAKGLRVLAVVVTRGQTEKECVGLIGLSDPIRPDAPALIRELADLGVRVVMITGDGRVTAGAIARDLGLEGAVFTPQDVKTNPALALTGVVFAEAYPEDKLTIIEALQKAGHIVGMTGDGVNDAPALHRAEVGIAVLGATEVATQAASFVLTSGGLEGVRRVVTAGRRVYTRLHTWVLNKVVKSIESLFIATVIFVLTHSYILSPLIAILILLSNDFVTIAIAADHTKPMSQPARWNIPVLVTGSFVIALAPYLATMSLYVLARHEGYSFDVTRTVVYTSLIYLGATTLLAVRAWPFGWSVRPKGILAAALIFSLAFSTLVAGLGIFIKPLPPIFFPLIVLSTITSYFLIEAVKRIPFVRRSVGV